MSSFLEDIPHERVGEKPPSFWASGVQVGLVSSHLRFREVLFKSDLGLGFQFTFILGTLAPLYAKARMFWSGLQES